MTVQAPSPRKIKTRFYNEIHVADGKVKKTSSYERIQTETRWFSAASTLIPMHVPRIFTSCKNGNKGSLCMEFIDSDNLYHQYREDNAYIHRDSILSEIAEVCSKMYVARSAPVRQDIREMYLEKPLAALRYLYEEKPFLNHALTVNGHSCRPPLALLPAIYDRLEKRLLQTEYSFIHGDLTFSNMVTDKYGRIYMFDPRGKFGSTSMIGDIRYDTAKLYFSCIANFDALNNHEFTIKQSSDNKKFDYAIENMLPNCDKIARFWQAFPDDHKAVEYINCSIWLSLFPHLQESDDQTLAAYLHGVYLLEALSRSLKV